MEKVTRGHPAIFPTCEIRSESERIEGIMKGNAQSKSE